jgi:hypothetical protein
MIALQIGCYTLAGAVFLFFLPAPFNAALRRWNRWWDAR